MTARLVAKLGHEFTDPSLLEHALMHRSYAAERDGEDDNERLEFLGDAVLQLVVTDHLFANYPSLREGTMAKVRAACVNRDELASIARQVDLGRHIVLGHGEEASGGRAKVSILADAMEAVIAAVYLDGGLGAARQVVLDLWRPLIEARAAEPGKRDYKTRLQEALAVRGFRPHYRVTESGPDHEKEFTAELEIDGRSYGVGTGRSKKEAEQEAASRALDELA
ncbi:MAG: ribonuclease III [Acidimicrobiia bacterium]|nr:ribonuclease III [Acidimicrobiia bacterium]